MKDRIKAVRRNPKINLSQEVFGAKIGVTGAAISRMESGVNNPSEQVILSICREYGVNEDWLRHGTGEMFVESTEDTLREIVRSRGLDSEDYELLREFINFSPEDRKALIRMLRQLAGRMEDYSAQRTQPQSPADMDARMAAMERRMEELEKEEESAPLFPVPAQNSSRSR